MAKRKTLQAGAAKPKSLSPKNKKFCELYACNGNNATRAYYESRRQKCSLVTARINGCKLLTRANIQEYIEYVTARDRQRIAVTRERVLLGFVDIAENGSDAHRLGAYNELWEKLRLASCQDSGDRGSTLGELHDLGGKMRKRT